MLSIVAVVTGKLFLNDTHTDSISFLPYNWRDIHRRIGICGYIFICVVRPIKQPLSIRYAHFAHLPHVSSCAPYTKVHEELGGRRALLPPACHVRRRIEFLQLHRIEYVVLRISGAMIPVADAFRMTA